MYKYLKAMLVQIFSFMCRCMFSNIEIMALLRLERGHYPNWTMRAVQTYAVCIHTFKYSMYLLASKRASQLCVQCTLIIGIIVTYVTHRVKPPRLIILCKHSLLSTFLWFEEKTIRVHTVSEYVTHSKNLLIIQLKTCNFEHLKQKLNKKVDDFMVVITPNGIRS